MNAIMMLQLEEESCCARYALAPADSECSLSCFQKHHNPYRCVTLPKAARWFLV